MDVMITDDNPESYADLLRNLRNQRPDIHIKQVTSAIEAWENFTVRHYDLIILDQFMGGGEKDGTSFLRKLKEHHTNEKPEIIFVTGNYEHMPIIELLDIDVPITLFLEKDLNFNDMLMVAIQLVMRRIDECVRYDPKELFGDQFITLILNECSQIIQKEHNGYYGMNQQRQIGTLIRSYINSLKMRSKWDVEDVLELSVFLGQSLCRVFGLHNDLIDVLRRFLSLEEVLYSLPYYRDHFFHQIKVFLLGFCIINNLNRNRNLSGTLLDGQNGMKMWFMASAFHDIGYPFEKMTRWVEGYIESTLRSPGDLERGKVIIPIQIQWGAMLGKRFHAYHLERIAHRICQLYNKDTPEVLAEILCEFTSFVVGTPDHGLYSSLIVQNFLRYKEEDNEIDPVAIAIALHNDDVSRVIKRVIGTQTFEKDPLSFMLAFCDLAQDWGRIRPVGINKSGYSKFGYPVFASDQLFDPISNTVRVILRYNREFSIQERSDWSENIYEKYIQPSRNCWAVSSGGNQGVHFCIEYQTASTTDRILEKLVY